MLNLNIYIYITYLLENKVLDEENPSTQNIYIVKNDSNKLGTKK